MSRRKLYPSELRDVLPRLEARYPEATFEVLYREDPDGMRLRTTVDVEDTDEVMDVVIDKLYDFQVEQGLPVYVVPVQPLARAGTELKARKLKPGKGRLPLLLPWP